MTSFSIQTNGNFTIDEFGTVKLFLQSLSVDDSYVATLEVTPLNQGRFYTSTTTQAVQYRYLVKHNIGDGDSGGDEDDLLDNDDYVECTGAISIDTQIRNVISQRQWAARRISPSPAQASVALTCGLALILIPYRAVAFADKTKKKPSVWREARLVTYFICGLFVTLIITFTKDEYYTP
jgi:hypothetical protein